MATLPLGLNSQADTRSAGGVALRVGTQGVVERTLGWINRARRLSKDFEATIESAVAWLQLALAFLLMRRLSRAKAGQI
jgi:hypothetical protein